MCKQGYPNPDYSENDIDQQIDTKIDNKIECVDEVLLDQIITLDISRFEELLLCEVIVKLLKQHLKQKYGLIDKMNLDLVGAALELYKSEEDKKDE